MNTDEFLEKIEQGQRDFRNISLRKANLFSAQLVLLNLDGVDLDESNLKNANLAGSSLSHTNLQNSNLSGANLLSTQCIKANFQGSDLSNSLLSGAEFQGCNFKRADLSNASCVGVDLSGCNLRYANLTNTNLKAAKLKGTDLFGAQIEGADFEGANLEDIIWPDGTEQITFQQTIPEEYQAGSNQDLANYQPSQFTSDFDENPVFKSFDSLSSHFSKPQESSPVPSQSPSTHPPSDASLKSEETSPKQLRFEDVEIDVTTTFRAGNNPAISSKELYLSNLSQPITEESHQQANLRIANQIASRLNQKVQYSFKRYVRTAYGDRCAISGIGISGILDPVMIYPEAELSRDHPSNGLLLRVDLARLFTLNVITINPSNYRVYLSPNLRDTDYQKFLGVTISLPKEPRYQPNLYCLKYHFDQCKWAFSEDGLPLDNPADVQPYSSLTKDPESLNNKDNLGDITTNQQTNLNQKTALPSLKQIFASITRELWAERSFTFNPSFLWKSRDVVQAPTNTKSLMGLVTDSEPEMAKSEAQIDDLNQAEDIPIASSNEMIETNEDTIVNVGEEGSVNCLVKSPHTEDNIENDRAEENQNSPSIISSSDDANEQKTIDTQDNEEDQQDSQELTALFESLDENPFPIPPPPPRSSVARNLDRLQSSIDEIIQDLQPYLGTENKDSNDVDELLEELDERSSQSTLGSMDNFGDFPNLIAEIWSDINVGSETSDPNPESLGFDMAHELPLAMEQEGGSVEVKDEELSESIGLPELSFDSHTQDLEETIISTGDRQELVLSAEAHEQDLTETVICSQDEQDFVESSEDHEQEGSETIVSNNDEQELIAPTDNHEQDLAETIVCVEDEQDLVESFNDPEQGVSETIVSEDNEQDLVESSGVYESEISETIVSTDDDQDVSTNEKQELIESTDDHELVISETIFSNHDAQELVEHSEDYEQEGLETIVPEDNAQELIAPTDNHEQDLAETIVCVEDEQDLVESFNDPEQGVSEAIVSTDDEQDLVESSGVYESEISETIVSTDDDQDVSTNEKQELIESTDDHELVISGTIVSNHDEQELVEHSEDSEQEGSETIVPEDNEQELIAPTDNHEQDLAETVICVEDEQDLVESFNDPEQGVSETIVSTDNEQELVEPVEEETITVDPCTTNFDTPHAEEELETNEERLPPPAPAPARRGLAQLLFQRFFKQ